MALVYEDSSIKEASLCSKKHSGFDLIAVLVTAHHSKGMLSVNGLEMLHLVNVMMNRHQQGGKIESIMRPQAREWFPDRNYLFMHDQGINWL